MAGPHRRARLAPGRRGRALALAAVGCVASAAVAAADFDSVRLRLGNVVGLGEIDGGALALTFTPARAPAWLYLPGDDLHVEAALSAWHDAGPDNDVYTAHLGPIWHYEPDFLGPRGFLEWGTSLAWVSAERVEQRDLGSRWHFTTHATLGVRFGARGRWHIAYRLRHTSNAGLASPNPGLDITMLELGFTPGARR